ncbi:hypothetical protein HYV70_02845 [Candidatus Uhrbacteria bacterium]|nr:hypothetical protein [Candidatus Uhrbacteria bacterium]
MNTIFLVLLLSNVVCFFIPGFWIQVWTTYRSLRLRHFGVFLVLLVIVAVGANTISNLHPAFAWGWSPTGDNIGIAPMSSAIKHGGLEKIVGMLGFVLILLVMPSAVLFEEKMFRYKKLAWGKVVFSSIVFGFMHCLLAGLSLGIGLILSVVGFVLAILYRKAYFHTFAKLDGEFMRIDEEDPSPISEDIRADLSHEAALKESTCYHLAYNTSLILIVIVVNL